MVPGPALASRRVASERGPWVLTYLPEMGTVTWRCNSKEAGARAYALGFRSVNRGATEQLTLRIKNRTVLTRTIQPRQSLSLRHLNSAVQELAVTQSTEPGTLRGIVSVNFAPGRTSPSHCFPWFPPAVTLHVYPRQSRTSTRLLPAPMCGMPRVRRRAASVARAELSHSPTAGVASFDQPRDGFKQRSWSGPTATVRTTKPNTPRLSGWQCSAGRRRAARSGTAPASARRR
jgi:hypothetical protein